MSRVWRLVAHHEDPERAVAWMLDAGRIAIGWGRIGDLRAIDPPDAPTITRLIGQAYPDLGNAHLGGPSLWRLYREVHPGDLVIIGSAGKRHHVVEAQGSYEWVEEAPYPDYQHQMMVSLTDRDPDELWRLSGGVAQGENHMWTLCRCSGDVPRPQRFSEGSSVEVRATVYERDPRARQVCLAHHGTNCCVCGFSFEAFYGPKGRGLIHVHHVVPLSKRGSAHDTDPLEDLRPVCPNCHAMIHRENPPLSLDELRGLLQ